MISQLFGSFLVRDGKLSFEQLRNVYDNQSKVRVKLGLIAVSEKLLSIEQADEINRLQAIMDKRFGDIAVEKGYLTNEQVSRLLGLQGNQYLSFVQSITDLGYLTINEIEEALSEYQQVLGFTQTDMDDMRSGDPDRIVPLFLPPGLSEYQVEHVLVGIRALIRLIDSNAYVDRAYFVDTVATNGIAMQALEGDRKASMSFIGENDSLLSLANVFAGEEFEEVDLDALDSVSEFINCVNGLFATKINAKLALDMLPPNYKKEDVIVRGNLLLVPIHINGSKVSMISTFDEIADF